MIKVIFMAKETYSSLKSLNYLLEKGICIEYAVLRKNDINLRKICIENEIQICTEMELIENNKNKEMDCDYLLSYYWKKAYPETLKIAKKGSINFHPGPLPEARGSAYHIAILEDWGYWGVTAHFMDEEYDTGDIIMCKRYSLDKNIVNIELVKSAHMYLFELFREVIDIILEGKELSGEKQSGGKYYNISNIENEKLVRDIDNTEQIDRKIKAFWNPPYRGAQIILNNKLYTIIDDDILSWIGDNIIK